MADRSEERREVYFSGRVQGVGFRYTVRSLAGRFAVTGQVRNLPDRRVEVVVEGEPDEVRRFLDAIQREMGRHISGVQETASAARGRFDGFEIAF